VILRNYRARGHQGPGYWGKTFFIWPPDPSTDSTVNLNAYSGLTQFNYPSDWCQRLFKQPGSSGTNFGGPVNHSPFQTRSGEPMP
jgi:hypothetical protein